MRDRNGFAGVGFDQTCAVRHQHVGRRAGDARQPELRFEHTEQTQRTNRDFADGGRRRLRLQTVEMQTKTNQH